MLACFNKVIGVYIKTFVLPRSWTLSFCPENNKKKKRSQNISKSCKNDPWGPMGHTGEGITKPQKIIKKRSLGLSRTPSSHPAVLAGWLARVLTVIREAGLEKL